MKILVVEDDYTSYMLLEITLKAEGYTVIHAKNGKEAVEYVENTQDIGIILMDIRLPVMSGIAATLAIKKMKPGLPIIAQTAYAFDEEKGQIIAAGCDDYITKPINSVVLLEKIQKYSLKA